MERSPLGRLPAEIRLEIYQHVLTIDGSLHLKAEKIHPHARAHGRWRWAVSRRLDSFHDFDLPKHMLAITLTCRQLRFEAWPIYFATNKWTITPRHMNGLRDWLNQLRLVDGIYFGEVEVRFAKYDAGWCYSDCGGVWPVSPSISCLAIFDQYVRIAGCFDHSRTRPKLVIEGLEGLHDRYRDKFHDLLQKHGDGRDWPQSEIGHHGLHNEVSWRQAMQTFKVTGSNLLKDMARWSADGTTGVLVPRHLEHVLMIQLRLVEILAPAAREHIKESPGFTERVLDPLRHELGNWIRRSPIQ